MKVEADLWKTQNLKDVDVSAYSLLCSF